MVLTKFQFLILTDYSPYLTMRWGCVMVRFVSKNASKNASKKTKTREKTGKKDKMEKNGSETTHSVIRPLLFKLLRNVKSN